MAEEFECEICMEDLIDSKVLPCGHSLCKKCKLNLLQFNEDGGAILNCPNQCENVTKIPSDQTIDDVIQTNYMLERWLASLHDEKNEAKVKCQGVNAHEALPSHYCKHCRKLLCKECFNEHECEGNDHIKIIYDAQKHCYHPICDAHKLFAESICKQCNYMLLCTYCKNRTHKDHEKDKLVSHIQRLKFEINARFDTAKYLSEKIEHSEDSVLKDLQNFRQDLTEELLLRKYINLSKYFAQLNEEESNVVKEFDEKMEEFITQRKQMVNSCNEIRKALEDRPEVSNLVMMAEQNGLLERLQEISNELLLKVVLHDRTPDNHLGKLQTSVEMKKAETVENGDCKMKPTFSEANSDNVNCKIVSERLSEMYNQLASSDLQRFASNFERNEYSIADVFAAIRNGKDNMKLRIALKTEHFQKRGYQLLQTAIGNNQWTMVKLILNSTNVDVNGMFLTELELLSCKNRWISIKRSYTALMIASIYGYKECVNLLLEKNANVNIRTDRGDTALMLALDYGHIECVKLLLEKNCDVGNKNINGYTALTLASMYGHTECVKLLLEKDCGLDNKNINKNTPLVLASWNGHNECVKLLLEKNCDVDNENTYGSTALVLASENGHTECMKLLLEKNCDVDHRNTLGSTALMLASWNGHSECVKLLLEKNCNVDNENTYGFTALELASRKGYIECVKLLLEKNCDVDTENTFGYTALMYASRDGHTECVKLLLEKNCDVDNENADGDTALMLALDYGHTECVKLLLEKNCNVEKKNVNEDTALTLASKNGYTECVKLLLEKKCKVDNKNSYEDTALMLASEMGHTECVKLLLEKNCNVENKNADGDTALTLATKDGHTECVKLLLEKNCDVDNRNTLGYTALMYASRDGHTECVKLLLEKNCDVDNENADGDTALTLALENGHTECVKLLRR